MGFQQVFVRFLGFIPAPTLFGSLIDESCNLWHVDECTGEKTSCLEYENRNFRNYIFTLGTATRLLSFLFLFAAYRAYQLPESSDVSIGNDKTSGVIEAARKSSNVVHTIEVAPQP